MTEGQQDLLAKAHRCLQAAELLLANGFPSDAASRAYYCMFHAVQALLEKDGLSFSKHSGLISAFGRLYARKGKVPVEFHRYMIDAFAARQYVDYAPREELTEKTAALHIERARTILYHIRTLIDVKE